MARDQERKTRHRRQACPVRLYHTPVPDWPGITSAALRLKGEGPFTLFAPTDAAFAKLPKGTVEDLLKPENKEELVKIVTYHVVPGRVMAADVVTLAKAKTVEESEARICAKSGNVMIDNANVVKTGIPASNSVIHVIDAVILPN